MMIKYFFIIAVTGRSSMSGLEPFPVIEDENGKDSNRKHELYSDAEPIKLHIKDFLSKAAQHIVDADITVGWQYR